MGGGAGGGAYSENTVTVVPGTTYNVVVGAGSAVGTTPGGDSYFYLTTTTNVLAKGGGSVADNSATGATGGAAANGIGSTKFSGGNGATVTTTGGGGGSSAGPAANGTNGVAAAFGNAPAGGGDGGAGAPNSTANAAGGAGVTPGGGGGGASRITGGTQAGGNGAAGQVVITYDAPATVTLSGLTQTYTGSALTPTATTVPTGLSVVWSNAPQTTVGIYPVTATINDPVYAGSTSGSFQILQATPTLSVSNSTVTYNGFPQAAVVAGSVAGTVSNIKYNGSATVPTAVGTYAITADFAPTDSTDYSSLTGASAGGFVVNPGALDHFSISTISSPQTAGTPITGITLTAQDAFNNTVISFTTTVTYSGTAGITGTSAAFTAGQLTGVSVTPTVAGSNLTFIVSGSGKTGTNTFIVNPGAIASYTVTATTPQTRGTAFTVTVTAKDANNNTVTTDSSTLVTMTSSTGNPVFDGNNDSTFGDNNKTLTNGQFTISAKDNYFETVTLTATDSTPKTGTSSAIIINPVAGDFISRATGTWATSTTWSNWNGTAWTTAAAAPTSATTNLICVQSPHTVTVGASVTATNFVLNTGGIVSISSTFTLTIGNGLANGVITGAGILKEIGIGNLLDLNGNNTYSGGTIISGGTVLVTNVATSGAQHLGSGGLTFDTGGTLWFTGTGAQTTAKAITLNSGGGVISMTNASGTITLTGTISGGGGLTSGGSDLILTPGSATTIGTLTVNSGRLFLSSANAIANSAVLNINSGATLDFQYAATPLNTMTFASGACLATRSGTLTVSTANVTFPSAGTMIFNSDDQATTGILINGSYPALTSDLTIQVGGSSTSVGNVTNAGAISGGFGLIKTSTGTLVLSGTNTYTGGTTVSAGSVIVKSTSSLGSDDVTVAGSAFLTLEATNSIAATANLLLNTSAIVTNNIAGPGTNNIGGLSFDGGATFQASGTWGTAAVAHTNTTFFKGTGKLNVIGRVSTTTLASSANPSTYGQSLTFTATVSGAGGPPTGTVQFKTNNVNFGGTVTLAAGSTNSAAITTLPAGSNVVTVVYSGDANFIASTGTLTGGQIVTKALLGITANDTNRSYGAVNPAFTYTASGFVNGDTTSVLSGSPSLTTTATTNSAVGGYPITAATGSLSAANYSFSFTNGTLTVNPTALSITASNQSKTYGATLPLGTGQTAFSASGLKNNETIGTLTLTASGGTNASAPVGTYSLTPSAATGGTFGATNYSITYNNGTLTVNAAVLGITANNTNRTYGAANPAFTYTASGFLNGDTTSVLSGSPSLTTTATTNSPVGTNYTIVTAAGTLSATNYTFTYTNGALTITPAALSVTANNTNKPYGTTLTLGAGQTAFTAAGLQNNETIGTVTLTAAGGTNTSAPTGTYPLTPNRHDRRRPTSQH